MTMVLSWRLPTAAISIGWRGPDGRVLAAAQTNPATPIAAVIGPVGPRLGERVQDIMTTPFAPDIDTSDFFRANALSADLSISNPVGVPEDFWRIVFRLRDDGSARSIAWGSAYLGGTTALPTTTIPGKVLHLGFGFDAVLGKWCLLSLTTH